jgi:putative ABC transport system permease protein
MRTWRGLRHTMLLFTLALSVLASLLASLIPAIRAVAVQPIA